MATSYHRRRDKSAVLFSGASEEMESGQVAESDLPHSEDDVVEPIQFQPAGVGSE